MSEPRTPPWAAANGAQYPDEWLEQLDPDDERAARYFDNAAAERAIAVWARQQAATEMGEHSPATRLYDEYLEDEWKRLETWLPAHAKTQDVQGRSGHTTAESVGHPDPANVAPQPETTILSAARSSAIGDVWQHPTLRVHEAAFNNVETRTHPITLKYTHTVENRYDQHQVAATTTSPLGHEIEIGQLNVTGFPDDMDVSVATHPLYRHQGVATAMADYLAAQGVEYPASSVFRTAAGEAFHQHLVDTGRVKEEDLPATLHEAPGAPLNSEQRARGREEAITAVGSAQQVDSMVEHWRKQGETSDTAHVRLTGPQDTLTRLHAIQTRVNAPEAAHQPARPEAPQMQAPAHGIN